MASRGDPVARLKHSLLALVLCLAASGLCRIARAAPTYTVIRAGRVVDVTAGKLLRDQVIIVADQRIEAMGPSASTKLPLGARTVDLTNSTVLPGLIDLHTHITVDPTLPPYHGFGLSVPRVALKGAAHARTTLLAGITTIRDLGASGYADLALRDAIRDHDVPGPRMLAAAYPIGMTGGHCDDNLLAPEIVVEAPGVADGVDAVRTAVRRNVKYGADVIKFCATGGVFSKGDTPGAVQYSPEEIAAVVREAHMHGRRVAAHAHGAEGIKLAIRAGADTIEHASLIDDEGLELAKRAGTYLVMDIYNSEYTQTEGPRNGELAEALQKDREIAELQRQSFKRAVAARVRLAFGTDAGIYPHGDNAKQLAFMVRYGMRPMQALQAATVHAADALGLKGTLGELAKGQRADIIAVHGDPSSDVSALSNVHFVMKDGTIYKQ
jgi:imidazolonepropionase-like amidohydrolase